MTSVVNLLQHIYIFLLQTTTSMIRLFSKFVRSRHSDLSTAFQQYDMDRNGLLGLDDFKLAVKDAGLRLTNVCTVIQI